MSELETHIQNVLERNKPFFEEAPSLAELIPLIIKIRRYIDVRENFHQFHVMVLNERDNLDSFHPRWLKAIVMTYAEHGNSTERAEATILFTCFTLFSSSQVHYNFYEKCGAKLPEDPASVEIPSYDQYAICFDLIEKNVITQPLRNICLTLKKRVQNNEFWALSHVAKALGPIFYKIDQTPGYDHITSMMYLPPELRE